MNTPTPFCHTRSNAGVVNGNISTERTFKPLDRSHAALDPLKKSLSTGYGMVENMKTLPPSSVGNDDAFAELGPLLSSRTNSNNLSPQRKHEVLLLLSYGKLFWKIIFI